MLPSIFEPYTIEGDDILPDKIAELKDGINYLSPALPMNFDRSLIPCSNPTI